MTYWLESGMKESPKELAGMAEGIMINGIRILSVPEAACP